MFRLPIFLTCMASLLGVLRASAAWPDAEGEWGETTVSTDTTIDLTGDVFLKGTISVNAGVTLTIRPAESASGEVAIKLGKDDLSGMFDVKGTLNILGRDDCWVAIDGQADLKVTPSVLPEFGADPENYFLTNINAVAHNTGNKTNLTTFAISVSGATSQLTLDHVSFHDIYNTSANLGSGACVRHNGSADTVTTTIRNCKFERCRAHTATAVLLKSNSHGVVVMENVDVSDCVAENDDNGSACGMVRSWGDTATSLFMTNCTIKHCYGHTRGAGLYWNGEASGNTVCVVDGCEFAYNYNGAYDGSQGGGGVTAAGPVQFEGKTTRVHHNYSNNMGAGLLLYVYDGGAAPSGSVMVNTILGESLYVYDNRSLKDGAGVAYLYKNTTLAGGSKVNILLEGAHVYNNVSGGNGGGLWISRGSNTTVDFLVHVDSGEIYDNVAARDGGGIYIAGGDITTIKGGVVRANTAAGRGGGLCIADSKTDILTSESGGAIVISGNRATVGGGMAIVGTKSTKKTVELDSGLVTGNISADGGGLYLTNAILSAAGGTIVNNTANRGGGMCLGMDGEATLRGTVSISCNVATNLGGGVAMNKRSTLTINEGYFTNNVAQMGGGAHVLLGAKMTIYGGTITGNRARYVADAGRQHTGKGEETTPKEWETAHNTERYDLCSGVGGAIYLGAGASSKANELTELICPGTEDKAVAVFGNIADKAGNEIVSAGKYTKLTLPKRELKDAAGRVLGWFEDYYIDDTDYPALMEPERTPNGMRYVDAMRQNLQVQISTDVAETVDNYLCLTLGYSVDRTVKSLWITDHADAGPGKIHLAFQPIAEEPLDMATWIPRAQKLNLVHYFAADTEVGLTNAPLQDVLSFRDGTGTQDVEKGWCWITVPSTNKLYKVVIDNKEPLGGVQLWENGPIWDTKNVGAKSTKDAGYAFWWGDTVGYTNVSSTKWASVSDGTTTYFGTNDKVATPSWRKDEETLRTNGWIDASGNLTAEHDAATQHLGAPWRMPTKAEMDDLLAKCTVERVSNWKNTGVSGFLVTGKETGYTDKSIFFPSTGYANGNGLQNKSQGYYWTSTPYTGQAKGDYAWWINYTSSSKTDYETRAYGVRVRGVREYVPDETK